MTLRTGGQILVDQLEIHGVKETFCVPGESYLAVLDALHDASIKTVICRQEGGVAMMAEAVGKLTGRPGIGFVTRGPGATNASPGIHIAMQDSTPMILFVGQVARDMKEREAFQELDYRAVFGSMAKWVVEIEDCRRIPELVSRAFHVAMQGRPGPVIVALPEDMLVDKADVPDASYAVPAETAPGVAEMAAFERQLLAARSPLLILGGSRWSIEAVARIEAFAARMDIPATCTFRRLNLFRATHSHYAGDLGIGPNPKLMARIKASDCLILVGGRLSEMASQSYALLGIPNPGQTLIHIHPGAEELNRVYQASLAIHASPSAFCAALEGIETPTIIPWAGAGAEANAAYRAWAEPSSITIPGALQMGAVMAHLKSVLPADTIICNGAGNFSGWANRFWPYGGYETMLAPTSGSMGYGIPAAVAAKMLRPDRMIVCLAGDGDFLMNGQEFATAIQYDLPFIVILVDNGMYGTIRMHQEREYPERISGTRLKNPDFAAYARAFGGHGETVRETGDFGPALERALASGKPAILHCLIDPEAITPSTTLSAIRAKAKEGEAKESEAKQG